MDESDKKTFVDNIQKVVRPLFRTWPRHATKNAKKVQKIASTTATKSI